MSNALPAREPSMDEILASIRRIIESGEEKSPSRRTAARQATGDGEQAVAPAPVTRAAPHDARGALSAPAIEMPASDEPAEASGFDSLARPANDAIRPASRPKLGIVPPASLADVQADESPSRSERQGARDRDEVGLEAVMRASSIAGVPQDSSGHDAEADGEATALSSARQQAASLAAASERRAEAVTVDAASEEEDAGSLATARTEAVSSDRSLDENGDFLGEFDEEEFASQLLDRAGLLSGERDDDEFAADEAPLSGGAVAQPADPEAAAIREPVTPQMAPVAMPSAADMQALISQEAGERIAGSFDDLARVIRDEQMRNMDETVREMLRPMLQEWLDDNLPRLVERLVREEIERVARGGRR